MLITRTVSVGGKACVETRSDSRYCILRDDQLYESALDPAELGRVYVETDIPVPAEEARVEDYEAALREMGVRV